MFKLLKAGIFRLKREAIFWLFILSSILMAAFTLFKGYNARTTELNLFKNNEFTILQGILIAIFVSIFVGKEYSEGIIRNKIIVRT